jgi:hypothetical protein
LLQQAHHLDLLGRASTIGMTRASMRVRAGWAATMRIKVVRRPTISHVDGVNLEHFAVGERYEVGVTLGALLLAEGWAVPCGDAVAAIVPFSDADPFVTRVSDGQTPPNLIRETYPPSADGITLAGEFERRRRPRPPRRTDQ